MTFKYSQLWNIALPTSLLRKETMANNAGETLCRIKICKSLKIVHSQKYLILETIFLSWQVLFELKTNELKIQAVKVMM